MAREAGQGRAGRLISYRPHHPAGRRFDSGHSHQGIDALFLQSNPAKGKEGMTARKRLASMGVPINLTQSQTEVARERGAGRFGCGGANVGICNTACVRIGSIPILPPNYGNVAQPGSAVGTKDGPGIDLAHGTTTQQVAGSNPAIPSIVRRTRLWRMSTARGGRRKKAYQ